MFEESKTNPKYKMHHLVKYECCDCDGEFIVSKVQAKGEVYMTCPYCNGTETEEVAELVDYDILNSLGCMGIGHTESEG